MMVLVTRPCIFDNTNTYMLMNKFTLLCGILFAVQFAAVSAQTTTTVNQMLVHNGDGSVVEYTTSDVNYVSFATTQIEETTDGKIINGHKLVDLGLPSGLLWAETNVGAETAADYGCYFAWGETDMTTKTSYKWATYKHGTKSTEITKYNSTDQKTALDKDDDAAYVNWSPFCRMPTMQEFVELNNTDNCTWTWTTQTNSSGTEISGYKVTSNKNGNSIFLPATGKYSEYSLILQGEKGRYWSRSRDSNTRAYLSLLDEDMHVSSGSDSRYAGVAVRPVAEP